MEIPGETGDLSYSSKSSACTPNLAEAGLVGFTSIKVPRILENAHGRLLRLLEARPQDAEKVRLGRC